MPTRCSIAGMCTIHIPMTKPLSAKATKVQARAVRKRRDGGDPVVEAVDSLITADHNAHPVCA